MKLPSSLAFALLLAACAHVPAPQALRSEVVPAGDTLIVLRYQPEDEGVARQARRALRAALPVASRWGELPSSITVTIHPTHEALEAAAHRAGRPWLRAWARGDSVEVQSPRTWSRGRASDAELAQLMAHELTHCALYHAIGEDARRARGVPAWFWEGMATTTAGERFAAVRGPPAEADPLAAPAIPATIESPLVYAAADQAFRSLEQRYGQRRIRQVLARIRSGAEFRDAFEEVLGTGLVEFEDQLRSQAGQARTRG